MNHTLITPVAGPLLLPGKHSVSSDMAFISRQTGQHESACEVLRDLGPMIGFFGGARWPNNHPLYIANEDWAEAICRAFDVHGVHGGGPSLMEATGKGARRAGKKSVGLCLTLERFALGDEDLDVKVQFDDFGPRIDAFMRYTPLGDILFPGGDGTGHELFAFRDNMAKKKTFKRPLLLAEPCKDFPYWEEFLAWFDKYMVGHGAVGQTERDYMQIVRTKEEAIEAIVRYWRANRPAGA